MRLFSKQQLDSLKSVDLEGIKIGLLPTVGVAEKALNFIKERTGVPVVLDPPCIGL